MSISCPRFIECTEVRAVGTRIRKHWDLPSGQGGALAVLGLCFLLGGLAGCLFAALAENQGAVELGSYLEGYLLLARDGGLSVPLWSLLWTRLRDLLAVLILGLTALGVAGIPLLMERFQKELGLSDNQLDALFYRNAYTFFQRFS